MEQTKDDLSSAVIIAKGIQKMGNAVEKMHDKYVAKKELAVKSNISSYQIIRNLSDKKMLQTQNK